MRSGILLVGLLALSGLGCGGSASETPWPRVPDDAEIGPEGEETPDRPIDTADGAPSKASEEEPASREQAEPSGAAPR
ncbi:hypothetical protein [Chondromyces crocatus]|uniref:Secreted protein n=1 Tax=Chondromyces crocatus TaxID=52 RepID=A0A0K1E6Q3_CHOCO|nr:hypothetical protein [Chondromyces crocatus]AKT36243.1 uncharacterized protein CMC5_003570 [Chondromyces crocatus]